MLSEHEFRKTTVPSAMAVHTNSNDTKASSVVIELPGSSSSERHCKSCHLGRVLSFPKYWISILFFDWYSSVLKIGNQRRLEEDDLFELSSTDESRALLLNFEIKLEQYNENHKTKRTIKILNILLAVFWKQFLFTGLLLIPYIGAHIAQPMFMKQIILIISNSDQFSLRYGYLCAIGLGLAALCQATVHHQFFFRSARLGIQIRNTLSSVIYTQMLKLKTNSLMKTTTGEVVNLLSNDIGKFEEFSIYAHYLWSAPLEAIIFFVIIYTNIGISTFFGYAILLLLVLLQMFFSKQFAKYRRRTVKWTDKRVKVINEILVGCEIVKMYTWEKALENMVCNELRREESKSINRANRLRAINIGLYFSSPIIISLATFGGLWLLNSGPLIPATIFTTLTLFGILRIPLTMQFPSAIEKLSEILVASKRIDSFMNLDESENKKIELKEDKKNISVPRGSILIEDASFSWNNNHVEHRPSHLTDINLNIKPGILVGILGAIGSGKSSLLSAILDEMNMLTGKKQINGKFAYVSQNAWLFKGTIRENILFGKPLDDEVKYKNVIEASCLSEDLKSFEPSGDLTIIGEKGVNLSGGQKARISLARALYASEDADLFLFDDPLAAVDSTVAKQIFDLCLSNNETSLLKNKTRLLVTHQIQFLPQTDYCLLLENGKIKKQGKFNELLQTELDIKQLYDKQETDNAVVNDKKKVTKTTFEMSTDTDKNCIVKDEELSGGVGRVPWKVWQVLLTSGYGWIGFIVSIFLIIIGECAYDISNRWLCLWSAKTSNEQRQLYHAVVYLSLCLGTLVLSLLRSMFFFKLLLRSTTILHNQMFRSVLNSSLRFYESNPAGRILNRFSKDQQIVDEILPMTFYDTVQSFIMTIGGLVIIGITNPWILLILIPILPISLWLRRFLVRSSTELKRLDGITRSPIYTLFSSTLSGIPIIRAFNRQEYLTDQFLLNLDRNTSISLISQGITHWFGLRLHLMTCSISLFTAIISIALRARLQPSAVALSLAYCINLTGIFQWAVRRSVETENCMTSTERVYDYTQIPPESDLLPPDTTIHNNNTNWSVKSGEIEFKDFKLRYRPELDYVLKNVNVKIESNSKVGVIGRTGAGKSSLFQALFRLIDKQCTDGQLLIDGKNINELSLYQLRSNLNAIPQTAVLFSNTLRYNLDPFNLYTEKQLWQALDDVQLKDKIMNLEQKLETQIAEYGQNFSVGECQLICIARAILKSSQTKILLIDEATANVDVHTDEIIQRVIRDKFTHHTVITIAHRLNTIADNDQILLLDNGLVADYGRPKTILFNKNYKRLSSTSIQLLKTKVDDDNGEIDITYF